MSGTNDCRVSVLAYGLNLTSRSIEPHEQQGLLLPKRIGTNCTCS